MAKEILFTITPLGKLSPVDPYSAETWAELPRGKVLGATIRQKRNLGHHRKFMALIGKIFEHQELYPTAERLRKGIQRSIGLGELYTDPLTKREAWEDESIAFDKMDQDEFEQVYDRAVDLICSQIIPGLGRSDLEREVNEIIAGRSAA